MNTKTKHTPGPWQAQHNGLGDAKVQVKCGWKYNDGAPFEPVIVERIDWPTALLISAAPELLKACKYCVDGLGSNSHGITLKEGTIKRIEAAIRKAEGE